MEKKVKMVLLIVAAAVCVPNLSCAQSTEVLFLKAAGVKMQNARQYTLELARLMPDDQYSFRPSTGMMTFGEQLLHLSANIGWLSSSYLGENESPVKQADMKLHKKDSIIAVVSRTYDFALDVLAQFETRHLADSVDFFAGRKTKLQIINLLHDHQTHHRGQLIVYLRMKGLQPPRYVGW